MTWSSTKRFNANKKKAMENRVKVQYIITRELFLQRYCKFYEKEKWFSYFKSRGLTPFCFKKENTKWFKNELRLWRQMLLEYYKTFTMCKGWKYFTLTSFKRPNQLEMHQKNWKITWKRKKEKWIWQKLWIDASLETFLNTKWFL